MHLLAAIVLVITRLSAADEVDPPDGTFVTEKEKDMQVMALFDAGACLAYF
jgi:hypothetical protein